MQTVLNKGIFQKKIYIKVLILQNINSGIFINKSQLKILKLDNSAIFKLQIYIFTKI